MPLREMYVSIKNKIIAELNAICGANIITPVNKPFADAVMLDMLCLKASQRYWQLINLKVVFESAL